MTRASNSSCPDQAQNFVKPDLGINCFAKVMSRRISVSQIFPTYGISFIYNVYQYLSLNFILVYNIYQFHQTSPFFT